MVCLGVPTLRPLYLRHRSLSIGYGDREHNSHADEQLPRFTMVDQKPPPAYVEPEAARAASASSSHTKVEAGDSSSLPARPPSAHLKGSHLPGEAGYDSVDEIFSLYDPESQRSQSQNSLHPNQNTGVIWVKSEVEIKRDADANWPLRE